MICLNPNGTLKWNFATETIVQTSPVVDNRGYIHIIDANSNYYVVKSDGTLFASTKLATSNTSSPVMDSKGRIYISVMKDGIPTMMCIESKASSYATASAWPMRGQNPCRTGRQK